MLFHQMSCRQFRSCLAISWGNEGWRRLLQTCPWCSSQRALLRPCSRGRTLPSPLSSIGHRPTLTLPQCLSVPVPGGRRMLYQGWTSDAVTWGQLEPSPLGRAPAAAAPGAQSRGSTTAGRCSPRDKAEPVTDYMLAGKTVRSVFVWTV